MNSSATPQRLSAATADGSREKQRISPTSNVGLVDRFGRKVSYLRMSVTDRCDFRCVYCMSEDMTFVPRAEVLSLEEFYRLGAAFVGQGVDRIRITGGEPLVRKDLPWLLERLAALDGLRELNVTTNGSQLTRFAPQLKAAGVTRLNISLDTLDDQRFSELTRTGKLQQVLDGIDAATAVGFDRIKLNSVILKGRNDHEVADLVQFAVDRGLDISFIEEMPLGVIDEHSRSLQFCSSAEVRSKVEEQHSLLPMTDKTGGPSRYWQVVGSNSRVGFISPHSNNFCSDCNRVRLTAEGRLLLCLGHEHSVDLRSLLRSPAVGCSDDALTEALQKAMLIKPERHEFDLTSEKPQLLRYMNLTGG